MNNNNNQQNPAGGGGGGLPQNQGVVGQNAAGGGGQNVAGQNAAGGGGQNVAGQNAAGQNAVAPVNVIAPVNGGVTTSGLAWTGGSRDPAIRALLNGPRTPMCCRSDTINRHVWTRCEKGVDDEWKIKLNNTLPLSTCEPIIHGGLQDVGVDSVFWMYVNGTWGDLFLHPDATRITDIRAHEDALRLACPYDRENLLYSRKFLENSVDQGLRRKVAPSLLPNDGDPVFWHLIKVAVHELKHQNLFVIRRSLRK